MTHFYRVTLLFVLKASLVLLLVHQLVLPSPSFGNQFKNRSQVLRLAVASNLRFSMNEIVTAFEKVSGLRLEVSYGASGNLLAQIIAGAPFDLFFSADEAMPLRLIEEGLGKPENYFIYGRGRIVLWVPHDSSIDIESFGMDALLHPSINKISIANPRHAPYGLAAIASLEYKALFERLEKKLVMGENVLHTAMFVKRGGAEIAILSYALALAGPLQQSGRYWLIPPDHHPALNQGGLILDRGQYQKEVQSLLHFIQTGPGLNILKKYGFFTEENLQ